MVSSRPGAAGATRTCPHCKTVILESAARCPACQHFLKIDSAPGSPIVARNAVKREETTTALQVEGRIRHPLEGGAWEYSVVLAIRDEDGKEITRQVVGVGALLVGDERTFSLSVEVTPTSDARRPTRSPLSRGRH
ncbi:hypothetical protein [Luteimonas sp. 3794]|uniref:hypothetical protein n=1 Tax=Luteimonas sp. 3794 TaxID=2817730 RepID=UPI00286A22BD|nr:hypothetical protein [Luteimonas sp. 3794]